MVKRHEAMGMTRTHPGYKPSGKEGAGHRGSSKGPHGSAKMPPRKSKGNLGTLSSMPKSVYHSGHKPGRKGEAY